MTYYQVRCPYCQRLAAEANEGATLRVKCVRCGRMFVQEVTAASSPIGR